MALGQTTPLMEQYARIKQQHPDEILFFRLGDFYEMFGEEAVEVSRLLNLTLTHRQDQKMCGIPYHAAKIYIARLLRMGKKIAICEQVGEIGRNGSLTERKVVEIITPGTAVDDEYLERGNNNFLASLSVSKGKVGFAYVDVTTSEFYATSWPVSQMKELFDKELCRSTPREFLLPLSLKENADINAALENLTGISVSYYPDWHFTQQSSYERLCAQFKTKNLSSFGLDENSSEVGPAGFLLDYLAKTTNAALPHVREIKVYHDSEFLIVDDSTGRNLEIVRNLRDGTSQYTLLDCVNRTLTAMGNRLIRSWLLYPLTDIKKITARQDFIQMFYDNEQLLKNVRQFLAPVLDIERLAGRVAMEKAHAKEIVALASSLESWLKVQEQVAQFDMAVSDSSESHFIIELVASAICDDPATSLTEGRLIREGWSPELDHLREIKNNFDKILEDYIEEERQNTGITNLKVKHNSLAGYFIEVSKGKISSVPSHFIMRKSLVNAERYTTQKLQELEHELNNAESTVVELERDLFIEVRKKIAEHIPYLLSLAKEIAYTDVASSLAFAACENRWVRPQIEESLCFEIKDGRHPVVEQHMASGEFIPNDILIRGIQSENQAGASEQSGSSELKGVPSFYLITGPNMAGKSTYLRQNALISLLAQTGSFVPASYARIGIVDKIFCRVGASDNLARGESTFLVEMSETARILRSATERSLVIMDEVGRGTSTEDGLSIAWAVSEYLLNNLKCRTLFATHYHELTRLVHDSLKLMFMDVSESEGSVVFLRKIKEGASANSYGIHVARLAGIPETVINRATEIISHIAALANDHPLIPADAAEALQTSSPSKTEKNVQNQAAFEAPQFNAPGLFSDEEIILDEILSCDLDNITPMAALQTISRWKKTLSGR